MSRKQRGRRQNNPAVNRKTLIEQQHLRIFTEIATSRFKWIGLPDSVDERFLELTLFSQGLCVFYRETEITNRYLALRASGQGPVNMYNNPTKFQVYGNTMINKPEPLNGNECVPIWGNTLRVPDHDTCFLYASRIAEIERTIEINTLAARTPFVIAVEESQRLTLQNAFRQIQEGQPVIFGTEAMQNLSDQVQVLDLRPQKDAFLDLEVLRTKQWNNCMMMLGVNNSNQDKKERLVESEVTSNNGQVNAARNSALDARRYAAEQINRMYGLSVSVHWNVDVDAIANDLAEGALL